MTAVTYFGDNMTFYKLNEKGEVKNVANLTQNMGWGNIPQQSQESLGRLHGHVAFLYSVHQYRATNVASFPRRIVRPDGSEVMEKDLPFKIDVNDLLTRWSINRDLWGTSYAYKVNDGRAITKIRYIDSETITPEYQTTDNFQTGYLRGQLTGFRRSADAVVPVEADGSSLMMYGFLPGTREGYPGVSPTMSCRSGALTLQYIDSAQRKFFESGAIDQHLIFGPQNMVVETEKQKFKAWFSKILKRGIRNQGDVMVLHPDSRVEKLNSPIKDWVIPELTAENKQEIADAHLTPLGLIEPERMSNKSLLDRASQNWINGTIKSVTQSMFDVLNEQLFTFYDLTIEVNPEGLNVNMEDETARTAAVKNLVDGGETLANAYAILGYKLPDSYEVQTQPEPVAETTPEPASVDSLAVRSAEIDVLTKFVKNGTHLKRAFTSDILTPDEIEFYTWKAEGGKSDERMKSFEAAINEFEKAMQADG